MAQPEGITKITVGGFKSIAREQSIEIRPLTILAGANSSGKSSMMQPLLLLKQTLEATYDPGPLLINGGHTNFTSSGQLFSRKEDNLVSYEFLVGLELEELQYPEGYPRDGRAIASFFKKATPNGLELYQMRHGEHFNTQYWEKHTLSEGMTSSEVIESGLPDIWKKLFPESEWQVSRSRCFLVASRKSKEGEKGTQLSFHDSFERLIREIIHVPGLRDNAARFYKTAAVKHNFEGTFDNYVASVVEDWQRNDQEALNRLVSDLAHLNLAWQLEARRMDDVSIELNVSRLPQRLARSDEDLVNIADVGLGVPQILPALVALHKAEEGRLVYIEQPELHLHPRAQTALAQVLASAANRGVRVVVETHSALFILGIQTLIAENYLSRHLVKLHWFEMLADGETRISSTDIDKTGAFTEDWPMDFADVELRAQSRFLDASEKAQMGVH